MAPQDMKGLTQYIADLRACRVREMEEKRVNREMAHIRQKFKEGNLDGYQRKKYLSKIVFTYVLGYPIDIGHMEAVNLIASTKYSEKQIGYLALTLLMHENSDLVRLVVNSIKKDLDDLSEVNNCLALHAIANIGGREMAETLAPDVHRLLISPTSKAFVKKKAALTLLRLYRKYPDCIDAAEWSLRIVSIMDDRHLGVALSVTSLVMAIAQDNLDAMSVCYQKAVNRLGKLVLEQEFSGDYLYYRVPIPWLQIKLLRLLQYYPPPDDPSTQRNLGKVIRKIIENAQDTPKNVQHANAQNAILFEAISLAIHLDAESGIVAAAAQLLGKFILSKETNVRYLGLDTMAHLAARSDSLAVVKKHQDTVIYSLKDRDISIRRRALDLLYSMCDGSNAKIIVGELLKYLSVADYTLREEMVLKIAILTEKFATEYEWYVDTILRLMSQAGDYVGEEVWYRIVQIVTNTEELQEYAARRVYEYLRQPTCHENIVKVAAYILGEFGHLIANEDDPNAISPIEQFSLINAKVSTSSPATKAIILTTYIKWLNLFPEIRQHILIIVQKFTYTLDAELQQRACEYMAIANLGDDDELLQIVVDEMPPFPEQRESALLGRLLKKHNDTGDKRTWVAGGKDVNRDRDADRYKGFADRHASRRKALPTNGDNDAVNERAAASVAAVHIEGVNGHANTHGALIDYGDDIMSNLAGLDLGVPIVNTAALADVSSTSYSALPTPTVETTALRGQDEESLLAPTPSSSLTRDRASSSVSNMSQGSSVAPTKASHSVAESEITKPSSSDASAPLPVQFTHGLDRWLSRFPYNAEGVLYEDAQLQIGVKSEYHGTQGRIALYFGNKISAQFTSFTVTAESRQPDALAVTIPKAAKSVLEGATQTQLVIEIECRTAFMYTPVLNVSYLAGSLQSLTLQLPVWINKFVEGVSLNASAFFERWKQIGGPPREAQAVFPVRLTSAGEIDFARNRKVIKGIKLGLLEGVDPNANNVVAAGVLHSKTGKIGCLLRLEPNAAAKLCRLTIRTTNDAVSAQLLAIIQGPLQDTTKK